MPLEAEVKRLSDALQRANADRLGVGRTKLTEQQLAKIKEEMRLLVEVFKTQQMYPLHQCASLIAKKFRKFSKVNTSGSMRVCFFGRTTNGKSTTINSLLGREAAKTRPYRGAQHTTQTLDVYRYNADIEFLDTPGFGQIQGKFAETGYFTALTAQREDTGFDLALIVAKDGISPDEVDVARILNRANIPYIFVITHVDKTLKDLGGDLNRFEEHKRRKLVELQGARGAYGSGTNCRGVLFVSPKTGFGMDELRANMERCLMELKAPRRIRALEEYYRQSQQIDQLTQYFMGILCRATYDKLEGALPSSLKIFNTLSVTPNLLTSSCKKILKMILGEFGYRWYTSGTLKDYVSKNPRIQSLSDCMLDLFCGIFTLGVDAIDSIPERNAKVKTVLKRVLHDEIRIVQDQAEDKLKELIMKYMDIDLRAKREPKGTAARIQGRRERAGQLGIEIQFP